ncbi:MAG TPA: RlmE family RNA methyltransferase [Candidatus Paceibacterota bacterium]
MAYVPHDKFAQKAKEKGYRARSAFKLLDLQKKFQLIKKGDMVLDLGAAPGSWMQVVSQIVGERGRVAGVDISSIETLGFPNVQTFQKSIADKDFVEFLRKQDPVVFHVVLSDIAPNTTGIKSRDEALSHELSMCVLEIATHVLKKKGNLVIKVFEGPETPWLVKEAKKHFARVHLAKPMASTKGSKELFLIAQNFLQNGQMA